MAEAPIIHAEAPIIPIDQVDRLNRDEITVSFMDGTSATFKVEDLLRLAPERGPADGEQGDE